jgi:hypothetical protein
MSGAGGNKGDGGDRKADHLMIAVQKNSIENISRTKGAVARRNQHFVEEKGPT